MLPESGSTPAAGPALAGGRATPLQATDIERELRQLGAEVGSLAPPIVFQSLGAVLVVVAGWYISKFAVRLSARTIARRFQRPSITRTVLRSVRVLVLSVSVLAALYVLGVRVGNLLISVTVFSAVIGIVLAPIAGSIINGLFVLADQPYEIGDMIELPERNQRGFVEDITIRYTKMMTLNNTFIVIPNASIRERDVVNFSAEDTRTRLSLQVLVTYEGDLDEARDLIERSARGVEEVIAGGPNIRIGAARYPAAPTCYIDDFADHGVLLNLRYWAKNPYKQLTVRSKVQTEVWTRLEDADVEIAYPHQHHVFDDTSGRARVAVENAGNGRSAGPPGPDGEAVDAERVDPGDGHEGEVSNGDEADADARRPDG